MIGEYSYYFGKPLWLVGLVVLVPVVWLGVRSLLSLGPVRRTVAIALRCVLIIILVALLARLTRKKQSDQLTVIAVLDRSQSIPVQLQYICDACAAKPYLIAVAQPMVRNYL